MENLTFSELTLKQQLYLFALILALIGALLLLVLFLFKKLFSKTFSKVFKNNKKINDGLTGSGLLKGREPEGFIFGKDGKQKVYLPNKEEGHITIFGGSGQGKTTALLIPSLRMWNAPFFSIDISGDISKNVPQGDLSRYVLSPDEPNESCLYNIFHLVDKAQTAAEKREKLEQLVYLIVDIPPNTQDAQLYFLNTARKIFLAAMIAFYGVGVDFVDICKTVFFNSLEDLAKLIRVTKNELAIGYIMPIIEENEKNTSGAKSALNDKVKLFADNENLQKLLRRPLKDFTTGETEHCFVPELIEDAQVFIKVPDKKQEYYAALMHIVTGQVLEYISGRAYNSKTDKRILIALDEFASLGHFEILSPFRKFRKNGANLCVLTQSLADIDLVYSEKERQVILDNSKYVVVLSATDNSTRDYFSNLIGKQTVKNVSKTTGNSNNSTSVSESRDYAVQPEEWKNNSDELTVIHPSGYCKLKKNFFFKD